MAAAAVLLLLVVRPRLRGDDRAVSGALSGPTWQGHYYLSVKPARPRPVNPSRPWSPENTNLKHRIQQLTREHRRLQERLEGARANLRFADKRAADLEMQVLELQPGNPGRHGPQTGTRPPSHP
ncbi:hypothetical protein [Streptomyces sp. NPDC097610]|uniref:hypothetical protein n=1 Tax=Streptomyces sp. NPDC097610 TaxID=3157227 RepID=UPI00333026E5